MTALLVSVIVWGIVAFMATDDYCRSHEKNALRFLVVVGTALTAIGGWSFEIDHFRQVSMHDWISVGFFPIVLLYLRLKTKLVEKQSDAEAHELSLCELELDDILDKKLVRQFRVLSAIMWGYAILVMIVHLWSRIET